MNNGYATEKEYCAEREQMNIQRDSDENTWKTARFYTEAKCGAKGVNGENNDRNETTHERRAITAREKEKMK